MGSRAQNVGIITSFLKEKGDETFISFITQLEAGCNEIEAYFAEYDYDDKTPANGFRSFVKAVDKSFENVAILTIQVSNKKNRKLLKEYEAVVSTLVKSLELARLVRQKGKNSDNTEISALDCEILLTAFNTSEADVRPFYSHVGPFWLRESFIPGSRKQKRMIATLSQTSIRKKLKVMSSKKYALKVMTRNVVNMSTATLKRVTNLHQFPTNILLRLMKKPVGVTVRRNVLIERNNDWVIEVIDSSAHAKIRQNPQEENERGAVKSVPCLVIQPTTTTGKQNKNRNNSLIFHSHGGAFIAGSPANFVPLLSGWANELGVTIVCPDYAKAPENPYPAGLQDLLDVYMFLTSGNDRVKDLLGFLPENIILTGDSAGGNLSPALTIALNMIRKLGGEVTMPKGINVQYPGANPGPVNFPSCVLMTFDTTLPPAACAICLSGYAQLEPKPEQGWQTKDHAADVLKQLSSRVKDPLYNILAYDDFEDLKDIPLRVMVCEFDPILDQGIEMAKKWTGDVKVQVARDLPHGFIMSRSHEPVKQEMKELVASLSELLVETGTNDKLV